MSFTTRIDASMRWQTSAISCGALPSRCALPKRIRCYCSGKGSCCTCNFKQASRRCFRHLLVPSAALRSASRSSRNSSEQIRCARKISTRRPHWSGTASLISSTMKPRRHLAV